LAATGLNPRLFGGVAILRNGVPVEAVSAAVRPGRHLPDGTLAQLRDDRSPAQRCRDGIKLGLKAGIGSGEMGSHRGHPVTVIVRTTLAELNRAAHAVTNPDIAMPAPARTGGDSALPMRDLIRMAADALHYLAVFDTHRDRPLYLGRQTRIATTDQRIICYARDGGCTRPNCLAPGYHSEVHHCPDWTPTGATDADQLFFACGPDHGRASRGELTTQVMPKRPTRLDRRHRPTRHQLRPPPRRTPARRPRPTRQPPAVRAASSWQPIPSRSAQTGTCRQITAGPPRRGQGVSVRSAQECRNHFSE
jgi:Domain of unknown function (DUF222)